MRGGEYIFIWATQVFTTLPNPHQIFFEPPRRKMTKKKNDLSPPEQSFTHLPYNLSYVRLTSIKSAWNMKDILLFSQII